MSDYAPSVNAFRLELRDREHPGIEWSSTWDEVGTVSMVYLHYKPDHIIRE